MRLAIAVVALLLLVPATASAADQFAPLDRPGPALSVPPDKLDASLHCDADVKDAKVEPVLLNPATGVTVEQNFSWNYERALAMLHIPFCTYDAPQHTLGDIQVSGEYLVHAIRATAALAGRKIAVVGHSQGGMSMRWALRFWPDTRALVDDVIGFSGSNHGTTVGQGDCAAGGCPAAVWQQGAGANFIKALNSGAETFPGISYTEIYTHTDEVVQPNSGANASAALHTGGGQITNVATQDVCPTDTDEHLMVGTVDPTAYALAVDALTHPGPADPRRIGTTSCAMAYQPGVDPANADMYLQILEGAPGLAAVSTPGVNAVGVPELPAEPALACYTSAAGCPGQPAAPAPAAAVPASCRSGRRFVIHLSRRLRSATISASASRGAAPAVRVRRAGRRLVATVDLRGRAKETTTLRIVGRTGAGRRVVQTRTYHPCTKRR